MSEFKHTPGPWNHIIKMDGFTAVAANALIARVFSVAFRDLENEKANAHLIAAAPDLLRVVEMMLEADRTAKHSDDFSLKIMLALEYGKAAIAKAEGRA